MDSLGYVLLACFGRKVLFFLGVGDEANFTQDCGHAGAPQNKKTCLLDPKSRSFGALYKLILNSFSKAQALFEESMLHKRKDDIGFFGIWVKAIITAFVVIF